jgi:aldose 1-epimerase
VTVASKLWVIETGDRRATFDLEHGGRLASLQIAGHELIPVEGKDLYHWGSFVLAPWTGRLRDGRFSHAGRDYHLPLTDPPNAIHGLVVDVPWQVVGPSTLGVELRDPWPWRGRIFHSVQLESDRLVSRLELHADEPMPAAIGWHPWFRRQLDGPGGPLGPVLIDVTPGRMYEHGADGLPTGELVAPKPPPWDDCFVELAGPVRLVWPGTERSGIELSIESDCQCWVLYDKEPQAICVEPWTAPPDSLNLSRPLVVRPQNPLTVTMTWRWRLF